MPEVIAKCIVRLLWLSKFHNLDVPLENKTICAQRYAESFSNNKYAVTFNAVLNSSELCSVICAQVAESTWLKAFKYLKYPYCLYLSPCESLSLPNPTEISIMKFSLIFSVYNSTSTPWKIQRTGKIFLATGV